MPTSVVRTLTTIKFDGNRVRMFTRNGHDWSDRYPLIREAALRHRSSSFVIDGEANFRPRVALPRNDFDAASWRGRTNNQPAGCATSVGAHV
jgi:ATP-dependent DNA ligase